MSLLSLAACREDPTARAESSPISQVDLCQALDKTLVQTALLGKIAGCHAAGDADDGYLTEFTGTAALGHGKTAPATLTVAYGRRYDPKTGIDQWASVGFAKGSRVALIGLGDQAVFDPERAQLMAVEGGLFISISLALTGAKAPQDGLDDHFMDLGGDLLAKLRR
jgi:hypothetical protein